MGPIRSCGRGMAKVLSWGGRATWSEYWWFVILGSAAQYGLAYAWFKPQADAYLRAIFAGASERAMDIALAAPPSALSQRFFAFADDIGWDGAGMVLLWSAVFLSVWFSIAATGAAWRRLHDTGRSGWWIGWQILAQFVTGFVSALAPVLGMALSVPVGLAMVLGTLAVLVFLLLPGDPAGNRYGPGRDGAAAPERRSTVLTEIPEVPMLSQDELRALRQSRMRGA